MPRRQAYETRATRPASEQTIHGEAEAAAHVMRGFAEAPAAFPHTAREEMRRYGDGLSSRTAQDEGAPERGAGDGRVRIRRL